MWLFRENASPSCVLRPRPRGMSYYRSSASSCASAGRRLSLHASESSCPRTRPARRAGFVGDEDTCLVACPPVTELTPGICRVDAAPEHMQQAVIGNLARVVDNFHRFIMSGAAGRHTLVIRGFCIAANVAGCGADDA